MQSVVFIEHSRRLAANTVKVEEFHVQDTYWNKFRKKEHLVGSCYRNVLT